MNKYIYNGLDVYYKSHLKGGGQLYQEDILSLFEYWNAPVSRRAYEWCAGPGFIGFALLAHGWCDTLCLSDISEEAVECCERTIRENGLTGQVKAYHSNGLRSIPDEEKGQWNLVVGNPPHMNRLCDKEGRSRLCSDLHWKIHKNFFKRIRDFLAPRGFILLAENGRSSRQRTFIDRITNSGLSVVWNSTEQPDNSMWHKYIIIYYLGIRETITREV